MEPEISTDVISPAGASAQDCPTPQKASDRQALIAEMEYSFISWTTAQQPQDRHTQRMVKAQAMRNLRRRQHWKGGRKRREPTNAEHQADPIVVTTQTLLSQEICCPSLNRMQLRSKALEYFFGELGNRVATSKYLREVATTHQLLELTLFARDLICVGRANGDQRMLHHGIESYMLAIRATRARLLRVDDEDRELLICVTHIFQVCEELLATSEREASNVHADAQACLAHGLGPPHRLTPGLQHLLLCNFRLFAIWDALTRGTVDLPADEQRGDCKFSGNDALITVARICTNAPRILCQARHFQKSPSSTSKDLFCSYVALSELERQLQRWAIQFHAEQPMIRADLNTFAIARSAELKCTFQDAHRFHSSINAAAYLVYIGTLLAIQIECEAISRHFMTVDPILAMPVLRAPLESVEDLCRTLPYFCEPQRGMFGAIQVRMALKLARRACKAYDLSDLESWCTALQTRTGGFENGI